MFPFLVNHGAIVIPTFSFMLMVASLAATFYAYFRAPGKGLSQVAVLDLGIIGTLAGIIGGRLFHVFVEEPRFYWEHPSYVYQIWRGGFVSYGAVIGITIAFYSYLKIKKLDIWNYGDLAALIIPILNFCVRIGCLGAGCCYGKPTDFFIHLTFTNRSSDAGYKFYGIPLHATQVYDMLVNGVLLFLILNWIDAHRKFKGQVIASFFIIYGFFRGMIEFLRGDLDRGVYGGIISTAQITGIVSISFGIFLYYHCKKLSELNVR